MSTQPTLDTLIALCKRRGFMYQSAEIYGGLNGVYDIGHLGVLLKKNIQQEWIRSIKQTSPDILFIEGSLLAPEAVWKASGHIDNFSDPMVDCMSCNYRYRADELDLTKGCPHCGKNNWTDVRQFNMMFKTNLGAAQSQSTTAYLRPETAQAVFINFKNVMSTNRVKIPFGIAQMGKAFRNEINPKQFLFRVREFEQMELEWFCTGEDAPKFFDLWRQSRLNFYKEIGVSSDRIRMRDHEKDELSHYSQGTSDVEYEFPFGWKEIEGIANRGNFDLTQHSTHSGKELAVFDEETKTSYVPHVVESSVGIGRLFLTLLFDAYHQDTLGSEERTVLSLHPRIAPIKAAFLPLTKKISEPLHKIYSDIQKQYPLIELEFDDSGSIGKRYRRQDEIGTPLCFTYDFDSQQDNCVTVRNRDTLQQDRISIDSIASYLINTLK